MIKISELSKDFYSSGDVAKMLGVVPMTVINYDKQGIMQFERTVTNRRIITKQNLIKYLDSVGLLLNDISNNRFDAVYCRVFTYEQYQIGDLSRQINNILAYVATQNPINVQVYKDIGSGVDDTRKHLIRLLNDIQQDKINRLFIANNNILTRYGFNYLNEVCKYHNTSIITVPNETVEKMLQDEEVCLDSVSVVNDNNETG